MSQRNKVWDQEEDATCCACGAKLRAVTQPYVGPLKKGKNATPGLSEA